MLPLVGDVSQNTEAVPSHPFLSLQPSHGDKAANPKVLKWMTDLTKIRRQIKGRHAHFFTPRVCVGVRACQGLRVYTQLHAI